MAAPGNLAELAEDALERQGDRNMLLFEDAFVTIGTILARAQRLQTALTELGVTRGRVVALCMTNHPLVYSVFGGIFRTGGAAAPVMPQLAAAELRYIFHHTEAIGVVTESSLLDKVRDAVRGLEHIRWLIVRDGVSNPEASPPEYALGALLESGTEGRLPAIAGDDLAMMLYTSGTTGHPKGVMLSHNNLLASARASLDAAEPHLRPHPVISLSSLPMAHIFGVGVMNGQYIYPETFELGYVIQEVWFDPARFLEIIEKRRVTDLAVVPAMLAMMLARPEIDDLDLSSMVQVYVGAAPVPVEVAEGFARKSGCFIKQLYGMTENAGIGSAGRISRGYRAGSAGLPYFNVELRIVDDNGQPVPAGTPGEIVTRGPSTMLGYFKDPEATATAMRNGWLHTGDIGYLDEEGFLFVVDRKKDMIIKGGENVFPAEVENAIYTHPGVAEAAVVGVPHDIYGEDIVAFVVRRPGATATEEELIEHVRSGIAPFKAPSSIHFVDELPKSGAGKILRRELRARLTSESRAAAASGAQSKD